MDFHRSIFFPRFDIKIDWLEKGDQPSETDEWGKRIYWHIRTGNPTVENGAWNYEKPARGAPKKLRNYIAFKWGSMDAPPAQLYNLEADPAKDHNVYEQHPEIVAALQQLLEETIGRSF